MTAAVCALDAVATTAGAAGLEEIIVTARRYATELQDTPLSVSALPEKMLHESRAGHITDWFARVPGLNYSDDGWGGHRTTIRGITSGTVGEPRPLSAWYLDDAPMMTLGGSPNSGGQLGGPHPEAIDLARIEVLRGPQGTLFGSNALGGAVRLITNRPELDVLSGWVNAGVSATEHGDSNIESSGVLNLPLVQKRAALRLVGYRLEDGGYVDDLARAIPDINSSDTSGGRLSFRWQVSPDLDLALRVFGQKRTSHGMSNTDIGAGDYGQRRSMEERDDESWELYNLTVDSALSWAQLISSTTYTDRQPLLVFDITNITGVFLGTPISGSTSVDDGIRDFVQELRLVSKADRKLSWLGGGYYQVQYRTGHSDWSVPGFDALTGGQAAQYGYPDNPFHTDSYSRLRQRAIYGELAYQFDSEWQLTLGARWFEFTEQLDDYVDGLLLGGPSESHNSSSEDGMTPRIGIEYRPSDSMLVFLNAAKGFRPGGANPYSPSALQACRDDLDALGLALAPPGFKSDSLWNYELGARTRWLADRLSASGAVYHIDWRDMQTIFILPTCAGPLVENAGRAVSRGMEVELAWLPRQSLELALSASYIDARLAARVPNLQGEDGQRIPTVPEWTGSASARQEFTWASALRGFVQMDYQYVGGSWNLYDKALRTWVPSRHNVNLRTGVRGRRWELEVFGENLFDERAVLFHTVNFIGEWQVIARPRTVGVRARAEF